MSNKIDITMTTNDQQTLAALQKVVGKLDDMNRKVDGIEKASQKSAGTTEKWLGSAAKLAVSYLSVGTALRLITGEMEKQRQIQDAANKAQVTAAQALRTIKFNFAADASVGSEAQLENMLIAMAGRTRSSVQNVASAAGDALSARGGLSNQQALNFVEASMRLTPEDPRTAATTASRAQDFAQFAGTDDPRALIGFMLRMQSSARITNLEMLGKSAVQPIKAGVQAGASMEEAGELFSVVNNLMADAEGSMSSTSTVSLVNQLKDFVPSTKMKGRLGQKLGVNQGQIQQFMSLKTPDQRIAFLQQNPELAEAFLASSTFEQKAKPAMEALITGDQSALDVQAAVRRTILSPAQSVSSFDAKLAALEGGQFQRGLTMQQESGSALESAQLTEPMRARIAGARAVMETVIENVDLPGVDALSASALRNRFAISGQQEPEEFVASWIRRMIEGDKEAYTLFGMGGGRPLSAPDRAVAEKQLQVLENTLNEIRNQSQINTSRPAAASLDR